MTYLKTSVSMQEEDRRLLAEVARRLGITPTAALRVALRSMAIDLRVDPAVIAASDDGVNGEPSDAMSRESLHRPRAEETQPQVAPRRGWGFAQTGQYRSWTERKTPGFWTKGPGYVVGADPSLTPDQAAERLVAAGHSNEPAHLLATRVAWYRRNRWGLDVPDYSEYVRRYNQAP
jgi:hypothetical protein